MIIVNQDKNTIVNFDRVETIYIVADLDGIEGVSYKICYKTNSRRNNLGEYKTGAKAREVLQEIWNFYEDAKRYEGSSNTGMTVFFGKKFTYEMPRK